MSTYIVFEDGFFGVALDEEGFWAEARLLFTRFSVNDYHDTVDIIYLPATTRAGAFPFPLD